MLISKLLIATVIVFVSGVSIVRTSESKTRAASTTVVETVKTELESHTPAAINFVGVWESNVLGHQTLTARPDGTATISMTLTPLAVPIYGRKVSLDLEWTLSGSYLTQRIVGGTPERSVGKLIRKFGDTHRYRVVTHDANHLLVQETAGRGKPVRWTAVEAAR